MTRRSSTTTVTADLAELNDRPGADRDPMIGTQRPATFCEAFQRTAAVDPDAVALRTVGGTQTLTWRQYADEVRAVAAGLSALGVGRGDTVALMMANRVEFYPLEVGAQHLGATSFSVYNTLAAEQLTHVLTNAGAKVVMCEEQYVERIRQSGAPVEHLVCVDGAPEGTITVADLVGRGSPDFDFEAAWRAVQPDDVLTLDLHLGHDRRAQGRGDDPREPAVRGVLARRGAAGRVR